MAKIYYRRIKDGKMTLDDVPTRWKEQVKEILIESGMEELIIDEE